MSNPSPICAAVIINAAAGSGHTPEWAAKLTELFARQGVEAQVTLAKSGAEIIATVEAAVAAGTELVVAGGGDGTINAVVSKIMGHAVTLGVLPLGTLNHFARDLQIPLDLEAAVAIVGARHRVKVDVAEVNGKVFVNNSSLGLYPDIVRHRERQQRRLGRSKWHAFFWALIAVVRRYPFLNVTLRLHDQQLRRRTPFVFIGNNDYVMEGFDIGKRARLDAGTLSLYSTNRTGRFGLLWLMCNAVFGRLRQVKDFDAAAVTEVLIETRHSHLRVSTDGEVNRMETPLRYRIHPGALSVIIPAPP